MATQILLVIEGFLLMGWGFWAAFNKKKPFDTIGALSIPVGLIFALLGVLLLFVPDFFS